MTDLERITNQRNYNRRLADHQKTVIDRLNAEITAIQDDARDKRDALLAAEELADAVDEWGAKGRTEETAAALNKAYGNYRAATGGAA